ncbi:hypothetical protein [Fibrobacter sp. UWB3]|uniref:hypothetical protein n=1 Tax=Fibrobacter sp. UWB3 TaxID=1964357 RepID=UPI000B5263A5|nr:hypothetical protein [Fibrobacter sp. UWB3]OWV19219.1 hypothetical protein B7991_08155 [Fibrobacter sp. UWB3]
MSTDAELAMAYILLCHEHLLTLCNLRDKLEIACDSEIGTFVSDCKDNRRLYLAYYFEYGENEYKFDICVSREEPRGTFFNLGFKRKDNHKIDCPTDTKNCQAILNAVNVKFGTNYGFSNEGKTLYLSSLSEENLKKFLEFAFSSCGLKKLSRYKSDCKNGFFTFTRAKEITRVP